MRSVRQLTDAGGAVTDTYDYDAWGNTVNVTGSTPNVYRYRGEQYDPDLNLYYLRARYFNPLTGRFLTRAPVRGEIMAPTTFHRYLYTHGNPVNYVDPKGTQDFIENALLQTNMALHWVSWATYQSAATAAGTTSISAYRLCPAWGAASVYISVAIKSTQALHVPTYGASESKQMVDIFCKSMGF
jgi:RHS repeat-associated protein